mgnify:CR=1 FL=1
MLAGEHLGPVSKTATDKLRAYLLAKSEDGISSRKGPHPFRKHALIEEWLDRHYHSKLLQLQELCSKNLSWDFALKKAKEIFVVCRNNNLFIKLEADTSQ